MFYWVSPDIWIPCSEKRVRGTLLSPLNSTSFGQFCRVDSGQFTRAETALGLKLSDLIALYKGQFPVLVGYEKETLYDANGNIVFRSRHPFSVDRDKLTTLLSQNEKKVLITYTDDTQPGGAVLRNIEYIAPFDRCDREQDYETAWRFFEGQYGKACK